MSSSLGQIRGAGSNTQMVSLEYQGVHKMRTITFNERSASAKLRSNISPHTCTCLLLECPCAVCFTPRKRSHPVACYRLKMSNVC